MNRDKDLRLSIAALRRAIQSRSDIEPEQKQIVEAAISRLKKLQRKQELSRSEVFRCVREVTEALLKAFWKNR